MKKFLSVVCLVALFVGCGSEANADSCPDISMQLRGDRGNISQLSLLSKEDGLKVNNLIINRGNCKYGKYYGYLSDGTGKLTEDEKRAQKRGDLTEKNLLAFFKDTWNFGNQRLTGVWCNWQSILEVTVETNKGTCTYKFNQK